jgi:pimeloyl-ACP methyl ester carboxylesterase
MHTMKSNIRAVAIFAAVFAAALAADSQKKESKMEQTIFYRTVKVDGLSIFYREVGPKGAPVILLLHGLPSSSRMFQSLLTRLAGAYHLIAPDYLGFGHSDWPDPAQWAYTFDHIASVMDGFTETLGLSRYTLYMQDYGAPVGFRMILAHPERVQALIVQDAVSHNEGLGVNWAARRAFWVDRDANEEKLRKNLLSLEATKTRHIGDDPHTELYDPDFWSDEYAFRTPRARRKFKAISFTTIAPTSTSIRRGGHGCKGRSQSYWSSGASTISLSIPASRNAIARKFQMLTFTCSTQDISRSTPKPTRLQRR